MISLLKVYFQYRNHLLCVASLQMPHKKSVRVLWSPVPRWHVLVDAGYIHEDSALIAPKLTPTSKEYSPECAFQAVSFHCIAGWLINSVTSGQN